MPPYSSENSRARTTSTLRLSVRLIRLETSPSRCTPRVPVVKRSRIEHRLAPRCAADIRLRASRVGRVEPIALGVRIPVLEAEVDERARGRVCEDRGLEYRAFGVIHRAGPTKIRRLSRPHPAEHAVPPEIQSPVLGHIGRWCLRVYNEFRQSVLLYRALVLKGAPQPND